MSITSRDIVAAEAHYHASCYKICVKEPLSSDENIKQTDHYHKELSASISLLYRYIRTDLFSKPRIIPLTDLTTKMASLLNDKGKEVRESTKKNLRHNLEIEFGDSLPFFTHNRRIYIRPLLLSTDAIACDYLDLKSRLENLSHVQHCEQLMIQTAAILRDKINN